MQMLRTLTEKQKTNWKESLNKLIYAYNCTRCEVTGFSPFYLLFGRSPRLPIDLVFGLTTEVGNVDHRTYMEKWKREMQEANEIVQANIKKSTERGKRHYDSRVRTSVLCPGDRVLVRNLTPRGGTGKLRNHWEEDIHIVIRQVGENNPVYEIKPEKGRGRTRTLHRNLLLPCDHLPLEIHPQPAIKQKKKTTLAEETDQEQESDEDECVYYYKPVVEYQAPITDMTTEPTRETPALDTDERGPNTNTAGRRQDDVFLRDENQSDVEPRVEFQEEVPISLHSGSGGNEEHNGRYPRRERRPPEILTYDRLGTPSCCSTSHTRREPYQYPSLQYREGQLVTVWTNPFQTYQPHDMRAY
ncbi:uncharacterized protein LOC130926733 [Corythoichthys intestinalis]|uniref:uncharacterized protein LOC130926733 n=1 Tax=Corythoichthys intestinalis TaxID=161448 RepID=UPI0025A5195C|nr:uncharacterized protein LOC130926733 [Corythoichthys intestinalis]